MAKLSGHFQQDLRGRLWFPNRGTYPSAICGAQWLPVTQAMPRMLEELRLHPELGRLHGENPADRTRSNDSAVLAVVEASAGVCEYATRSTCQPGLPLTGASGRMASDIWYETYEVAAGHMRRCMQTCRGGVWRGR